jgi:hypothetical protein
MEHIYAGRPDFRRLRAGLNAVITGVEEPMANERLHQFVRALDGLMMIPWGGGKGVFAQRGATFVCGTDLPNVLEELYKLRNAQEHMNDFKTVLGTRSATSDSGAARIVSDSRVTSRRLGSLLLPQVGSPFGPVRAHAFRYRLSFLQCQPPPSTSAHGATRSVRNRTASTSYTS